MTTPTPPVPRPGPLKGTEPLNARTRLKLLRLTARHLDRYAVTILLGILLISTVMHALLSWAVGNPRTPGQLAVDSALLLGVSVLLGFPIGQAVTIARWRRNSGWVVGYFDSTAALLVHPKDGTWVLSDHLAEHKGQGLARPFRQKVFAHLAAEADRLGVPILTDTSVRALADLYAVDLPGLEMIDQVSRDWRGRTCYNLRREPHAL